MVRSKSASLTSSARFAGTKTGVVDEDVQPTETLHDARRPPAAIWSRHVDVHLDGQRAATHRLDLGHEVVGRTRLAQAQRDIGPRVGQSQRDRPPQAARRPGDQRGLAGEAEARGRSAPILQIVFGEGLIA